MRIERRYLNNEVRADDSDGSPKIKGYGAVFGVRSEDLGGWVEVINPNAFTETLADPTMDCRCLWNHNADFPLGRNVAGTLSLSVDERGLAYVCDPPDTSYARDLMVSMKRGDVTQSSFGFICEEASWGYDEVTGQEIRTVLRAKLFDVSPVTYPAYTDATSEVRGLPADMPVEVRSRIEQRSGKPVTTPTPEHRDDADAECACDCPQCEADACGLCSNQDCDDDNCGCDQRSKSLHELRVRLALQETYS